MDKTPFADLTRLTAGDPLSLDGASFLWRNPTIIDRLLRIGARTHRHDNHAALANPAGEPVVVADATQGSIAADTTVTVAYTLVDDDGGETLPSPITAAATPAAMEPPALTPDVSVAYDAGGGITIGSYFYAVTLVDDSGGETTVGAAVQADREPGGATAKIVISGLAAIVADTPGATGWRLYRATGGGSFRFLEDGASDEVVDDGTLCADCDTTPPTANTTNRTNAIRVTIPDTLDVQDAAGVRIYMSTNGDFVSPALAEVLPVDQAGVELVYTSIVLEEGSPPDVSTSIGGAQQIDADTELANFFWRPTVANAAALAALVDNQIGDIRLVLDELSLYVWDGAAWLLVVGGSVAWKGVWGVATAYEVDDVVQRDGSSYVAVAATTGVDPALDGGVNWLLVAAKGAAGAAGALPSRTDEVATAAGLAAGAEANLSMALGKFYHLLKLVTNRPTRVRVYANAAYRAADAIRAIGVDPVGDHGLLFEFVTEPGALSSALAPPVGGFNLEDPVTSDAAVRVTNLDAAAGDVTVTFTKLEQEA